MDRCKLEYMIKNFDIKQKKKIIQEIDPYGSYKFIKDYSNFLLDPETEDFNILIQIPEILYIPGEKELFIKEFIEQYKLINELCIENNIYPFFKDYTNVAECEMTRLDIVKIVPEERLNEFFGVNSIRDYEPPVYNKK